MDALYEVWENNYNVDYGNKSKEYEDLTKNRTEDQKSLVSQQQRWDGDNKLKTKNRV